MDSTNVPPQTWVAECDQLRNEVKRLRALIATYVQAAEVAYALERTQFPDEQVEAVEVAAQRAYEALVREASSGR